MTVGGRCQLTLLLEEERKKKKTKKKKKRKKKTQKKKKRNLDAIARVQSASLCVSIELHAQSSLLLSGASSLPRADPTHRSQGSNQWPQSPVQLRDCILR
jgi:hypothetical protein